MWQQKKLNEITVKNEPYEYNGNAPLLSIHLASNRPIQFTEFVENIHTSCSNKNSYEIIVKIDTEDTRMIECVNELKNKYGEHRIKPLIGPRLLGPWSTWEFYNEMFHMTHPDCYFLWNPSDEVRIDTHGWDKILAKYIGFFNDHIFRLKLSDNRLRNFYHLKEVLGTPDNFPFITKKWMDICGLWGDCHSPDVFHQAVAFYLGKKDIFRDIAIFDIELSGIEAGLLIPADKVRSRTLNIHRLWRRALSRKIRNRYLMHATKLEFYINSCKKSAKEITFKENIETDVVHCTNNLRTTQITKCKDIPLHTGQIDIFLKGLRPQLAPIKFWALFPFKYLIRWNSFEVVSGDKKQQKIDYIKTSNNSPLTGFHYLLVKQDFSWELIHCHPKKEPANIPIESIKGLEEELQHLPAKYPEELYSRDTKKVRRKILSYHLSNLFKI